MTKKLVQILGPINAPSRRGHGSGYTDSRSASPRSRGRLTPPLPEPPSRTPVYKPALVFALTCCVGYNVSIQTRNGELFEGILHTPGLVQSEVHFVLKKARKLNKEGDVGDFIERLVIPSAEVVQMHAKDLPMQQEAPSRPSASPVLGFPINADSDQVVIQFGDFEDLGFLGDKDRERQGAGLFGRKLEKWEPEEGVSLTDFEEGEHEVGAWDQFAENEKKFGVKTDFNMDLYTTRLEPEKSRYTVAQAEKLAREIQSASSPNLHLQDERNQLSLDDSGISDEQLYSSVLTEGLEKMEKTATTPKKGGGRQRAEEKHSSKSPERRRMAHRPLILHHGTRPMIITNPRHDNSTYTRSEFNALAREISSGKPIPQGSPLNTSPLLNDPERVKALDLTPGTERKTLQPEVRANFKKFKATAGVEKPGLVRRPETREETVAKLKAFSEQYDVKFKKKISMGAESPFSTSPVIHQRTPVTPVAADRNPTGFGSQLLPDDIEPKSVELEHEDTSPDVITQRELPKLRTEREGVDDDDQGEDHSGRGLNPHATPFNPSHAFPNKSEASLSQTSSDESAVDPSPHASIGEASESVDPCEKTASEEVEVYVPMAPPPMPETLIPTMPHPAQPAVLIRPQPPPPPPRVVTPPPPPPVPIPDVHQQPPMVIPMVRPPHRPQPARPSQSPGGRRTPQHHMSQDPPNMVINSPSMIMTAPQSGPPPPSSGPPLPSNGPPPPVVPAMPPHMSGAMHIMPQHVAHYPYSEVAGRVPVYYSYPGPMAPVPGPPAPPGQQNNPNGEQGMPPPQVVYSYYHPAMSQYHMHYPPMVPQGMPPQFVPMPPTPMTPQRPGSTGARPRARRSKGSFFSYGPRRG